MFFLRDIRQFESKTKEKNFNLSKTHQNHIPIILQDETELSHAKLCKTCPKFSLTYNSPIIVLNMNQSGRLKNFSISKKL